MRSRLSTVTLTHAPITDASAGAVVSGIVSYSSSSTRWAPGTATVMARPPALSRADRPTRGLGQTHRDGVREVAHQQDQRRRAGDPGRDAHSTCDRCRGARPARRAAALREARLPAQWHTRIASATSAPARRAGRSATPPHPTDTNSPSRGRHLEPELRVERHRRIEVLDNRTLPIAHQSRMPRRAPCPRPSARDEGLEVQRCDETERRHNCGQRERGACHDPSGTATTCTAVHV